MIYTAILVFAQFNLLRTKTHTHTLTRVDGMKRKIVVEEKKKFNFSCSYIMKGAI